MLSQRVIARCRLYPLEIESPEGELKGNSGPLNDLLMAENPPIDTKVL
jgi:hypothetical protein